MDLPTSLLDTGGGAREELLALPPGRHYGASSDRRCWTMVGRTVRDVETWSIVPPSASLTLAWGAGGCEISFDGGGFEVTSGHWMWIDVGFAHRGRNVAGSDFLTVMFSDDCVRQACLHLAPIGARAHPAPPPLADLLISLAALMLRGGHNAGFELPARDALLDWVGTTFPPRDTPDPGDPPIERAVAILRSDPLSDRTLSDIAAELGLGASALSRRFARRYHMTPVAFRRQLRLAIATRALVSGQSVTDAALSSGFADTAHLSRTFKDQYGIAPSRWAEVVARA